MRATVGSLRHHQQNVHLCPYSGSRWWGKFFKKMLFLRLSSFRAPNNVPLRSHQLGIVADMKHGSAYELCEFKHYKGILISWFMSLLVSFSSTFVLSLTAEVVPLYYSQERIAFGCGGLISFSLMEAVLVEVRHRWAAANLRIKVWSDSSGLWVSRNKKRTANWSASHRHRGMGREGAKR